MSSNDSNSSLALTPLGAGDLIDRAVRFYHKNFRTFVWIASPPILFGTLISIGWTILGQQLLNVNAGSKNQNEVLTILLTVFGNLIIFFFQMVAMLIVMGGASRNFVRHLLFGESITFRETYSNAGSRFFGLLGASVIIVTVLSVIGFILLWLGVFVALLVVGLVSFILQWVPPLASVIGLALGIGILLGTGWVFFLVASRFAYVPQVMLVEGQAVFPAMSRAASLASGNVMRIYSLFIFTVVATSSALLLFYFPLNLYGYFNGIQFLSADPDAIPAWYIIANQVIWQASFILLIPILMIGLCLLYVDERVRYEGYDIELMAARNLGEIPTLPTEYSNPLQPALSPETFSKASDSPKTTILGLK